MKKQNKKIASPQRKLGIILSLRASIVLVCTIVLFGFILLLSERKNLVAYKPSIPVFPSAQIQQWCHTCSAETISIPAINFVDTTIAKVSFDVKQKTWPTPETGIATPKEAIANNVIIFGHSKWFGTQYPFADIAKLKNGDLIIITDQYGKTHSFRVDQLALVDRNDGDAVHSKSNFQLTLLTSARYKGEWLLPTAVDMGTIDQTKSDADYAIFVVTAKPL